MNLLVSSSIKLILHLQILIFASQVQVALAISLFEVALTAPGHHGSYGYGHHGSYGYGQKYSH